ncbi:MAG: hypothetical protein KTR14_03925 [Vampirovibrio sp.]|nr:hypothetical protein [Vampirovibrio sp.]
MKKTLAALLLAGAMVAQAGAGAFAEDGPWTTDSPVTWGITSLPLRVVTGAAGAGIGMVSGSVEGIIDTEKEFASNTFEKADENPFLVPVGLVGTAVAIPVGIIKGGPKDAVDMGRDGYLWWNRF